MTEKHHSKATLQKTERLISLSYLLFCGKVETDRYLKGYVPYITV